MTLDPDVVLSTENIANYSPTIYTMRPSKMEFFKYVSIRAVIGLATADIGRRIAEATIAIFPKDGQRLYRLLLRIGETKALAGWIFEACMHQIFQCGGPFNATNLVGSAAITNDIDHKACKDFSQISELGSLLRKLPGPQSINPDIIGGYFKPEHRNLRSLNLVAMKPDSPQPINRYWCCSK